MEYVSRQTSSAMLSRLIVALPYAAALAAAVVLILLMPMQQQEPLHKPSLLSQQQVDAGSRTSLGMVVNWARTLRANQQRPESLTWERLMANADGSIVCIAFAARDEANALITRRIAFVSDHGAMHGGDWEQHCRGDVTVVADAEKWIATP